MSSHDAYIVFALCNCLPLELFEEKHTSPAMLVDYFVGSICFCFVFRARYDSIACECRRRDHSPARVQEVGIAITIEIELTVTALDTRCSRMVGHSLPFYDVSRLLFGRVFLLQHYLQYRPVGCCSCRLVNASSSTKPAFLQICF